jgi:hypothetical protein
MCNPRQSRAAQPGAARASQLGPASRKPGKFNGKAVLVRGFLLITPHDVVSYTLFLHKEDAENNLGNSVDVVPNEQMKRDQEKIDRVYVQITGTVRSIHISGTADSYVLSIRAVKSCNVWSDPNHPIALKLLDKKPKWDGHLSERAVTVLAGAAPDLPPSSAHGIFEPLTA